MITVPQVVTQIIRESPYLSDGLARDLINISALAREIRPQVETELMKRVSHAAVVMAVKRYASTKDVRPINHPRNFFSELSIKSDLSAFAVENTPELADQIAALQREGWKQQAAHITVVKGVWGSTIVISNSLQKALHKHLTNAKFVDKYGSIAAMTLRYKDEHHEIPGLIQYPLQLLAWRGISLYHVVSTIDEITLILAQKNVEPSFQALRILRTGSED